MLAKLAHTPERRHLALLEAVAQRGDALGGERAIAIFDTAELVVVQAARTNNEQFQECDMARYHTTTSVGRRLTSD